MTTSEFEGMERTIPATEARRKMDMAEATLYAQLDPKHARELWAHWTRQANPPPPIAVPPAGGGSRFYWNGAPVDATTLRGNLAGALGAGLTA